jgi:hypothetical protein
MISPDFLERYYAPQLRYGLEPLLEVGCRPVWHCDGDVVATEGRRYGISTQAKTLYEFKNLTIRW